MKISLPRNPIALVGVFLATTGAFLFLTFWVLELLGRRSNPYAGMVFLVILPSIFVLGLLLIPIGLWRDRVKRRSGVALGWPRVDFNNPRHRNVAFFLVMATFVNILIVSMAAYSGLHYMEQSEFCGQVCHSVMEPEFTAFQNSPHSRVGCVECHVGPGASGLVASKLSGLRQVVSLTFSRYARPIPAPVHNLVPARETCEQCQHHAAD